MELLFYVIAGLGLLTVFGRIAKRTLSNFGYGSFRSYKLSKGEIGEERVYNAIESAALTNIHILRNVYLRKDDGTTTEIDILVICQKGILVFEVKNYGGKVYGRSDKKEWKQYFPKSPKAFPLYNPIWQNHGHIKAIKKIIPFNIDIRYFSVILFNDYCGLHITKYNIDPKTIIISYIGQTKSILYSINDGDFPDCLSSAQVDEIKDIIVSNQASEEEIWNHIKNIDKIKNAQ